MALRLVTDNGDVTPARASAVPAQPVVLTPGEITGLIGVFQTMLTEAIKPVLGALEDRDERDAKLWDRHDKDHAVADERLSALETSVRAHHKEAHDAKVAFNSRVQPVQTMAGWIFDHWERIVLLLILLVAVVTATGEWFGRIIGPHAP